MVICSLVALNKYSKKKHKSRKGNSQGVLKRASNCKKKRKINDRGYEFLGFDHVLLALFDLTLVDLNFSF